MTVFFFSILFIILGFNGHSTNDARVTRVGSGSTLSINIIWTHSYSALCLIARRIKRVFFSFFLIEFVHPIYYGSLFVLVSICNMDGLIQVVTEASFVPHHTGLSSIASFTLDSLTSLKESAASNSMQHAYTVRTCVWHHG